MAHESSLSQRTNPVTPTTPPGGNLWLHEVRVYWSERAPRPACDSASISSCTRRALTAAMLDLMRLETTQDHAG